MGWDLAPFFTNLFLHNYKGRWIRHLRNSDIMFADDRIFANVSSFIDDLTAINDGGEFERSSKQIYPPEPELKKENVGCSEGSFLDLAIKIEHKKDDFSFSICRMCGITVFLNKQHKSGLVLCLLFLIIFQKFPK